MSHLFDIDRIRDAWPVERLLDTLGYNVSHGRSRCPLCDPSHTRSRKDAMSVSRDGWCCFRCGERGDVFSLYMLVHGVRFREALEALWSDERLPPTSDCGAPRVPRVSRNRIRDIAKDNWVRLNGLIQKRRDAKIKQAKAVVEVLGSEDSIWDIVEANMIADRQWDMLDGATNEILFYAKERR